MGCGNVSIVKIDQKISLEEKQRLELLSSKTNIRDVYNFQGVLGKGGFGTVKLAVMKNGNNDKKIAVKIIEKSRVKNKQYILLREFETLKTLDHPNIIKFYEVYQDEMFFYICMEYCAGGELLERIT
jgi:calcium-dependent protein kinase